MSEIYARYIPPSAAQSAAQEKPQLSAKRPSTFKPHPEAKKRKTEHTEDGRRILSKYSVTGITQESGKRNSQKEGSSKRAHVDDEVPNGSSQPHHDDATWRNSEILGGTNNGSEISDDDVKAVVAKHSKVLSRFSKSRIKATQAVDVIPRSSQELSMNDVHPDRAKFHDLAPLPQPEVIAADAVTPAYSTLPAWLQTPLRVDQTVRRSFKDFGLYPKLLRNLANQGKKTALPIQSGVLPLLLGIPLGRRPDLCIAAATGSGKTFAYLLPILNDIRGRSLLKLQAVIVVPTRALVKQVIQALQDCSDGLELQMGSAEGSKTLAEEQRQLVEEEWTYDPVEYRRQQGAHIDWGRLSLDDILDHAEKFDPTDNIGYIKSWKSKVNILVCTPGRLVEHLQSTKGFSLDDVQWFVVDEVDRLLNESYRDWLDTVLPALKSRQASEKRDRILSSCRMDVLGRRVNKILLSATMTNDISRLLGLELTDPKLVVVEELTKRSIAETDQPQNETLYQLPPQLHESAIAFKDSENKPLYLLELLNEHVFSVDVKDPHRGKKRSPGHAETAEASSISSLDSDEDEDDATSSSGSDLSSDDGSNTGSVSSLANSSLSSSAPSPQTDKSNTISETKTSIQKLQNAFPRVLIFTKSTESAHRLSRLLCLLQPQLDPLINTFTRSPATTKDTNTRKKNGSFSRNRNKILKSFTAGQTRILISTDLAGRGLDIPHLAHVVNYDVPASALTYVHRVGRTARAGEVGQAWTLVEHKQGKWFWETMGGKTVKNKKSMINRGDNVIKKVNVSIDKEKWTTRYETALRKLGEDVRGQ